MAFSAGGTAFRKSVFESLLWRHVYILSHAQVLLWQGDEGTVIGDPPPRGVGQG